MPHNFRPSSQRPLSPQRKSFSINRNDPYRISLAPNPSIVNLYRETMGTLSNPRISFATTAVEPILEGRQDSLSNLKSTLNALQRKINRAKKHLNNQDCILSEDESSQESEKVVWDDKKNYETTTASCSVAKLTPQKQPSHQIKHYYLSQLVNALNGSNQRALDHIVISHKILKNYHIIQSPTFADIEERKVNLPRHKADLNKKTLLIDIDETILHCEQDDSKPYDVRVPVKLQNGEKAQAYLSFRPYAITFLKRMSRLFEVIAFTASEGAYADVVLDQIDPNREYIRHRLYRHNCIQIHQNIYAKDLRIVNRDLRQMVLVDNAPYSYIYQLQNGVPILPYYSGEDRQLFGLQKYLQQVAKCEDVRQLNKNRFRFHQYRHYEDVEEMIAEVYFATP